MSPVTVANFVETHGPTLPSRIDKSMMTNLAGGDRPKLLNSLKFLGLTEPPNDVPTPLFERFRDTDEGARASAWREVALTRYADAVEGLDLASATQAQVEERFRQAYGISGDTVRKAVAFFLALARMGNVELSTYVKKTRPRGASPSGARTRTPRASRAAGKANTPGAGGGTTPNEKPVGSSAMVVRFKSGGTATLFVAADWVTISTEDRNALIGWIDSMKQYAAANPVAENDEAQAAT
jgi:hypothetical protein